MKRILSVLVILLWATTAWSGMQAPRKLVAASGGSCTTQSLLLNQSGTLAGSHNIYDSNIVSGFKITGNGKKLHSVVLRSGQDNGTSASYTVYVNTTTTFSGAVTDSFSITTPGANETEFTGTSTNQPTLANGTTYYIAMHSATAGWGGRTSLTTIDDAVNQNWYTGSSGLDSATQALGNGRSTWAKVYVCD